MTPAQKAWATRRARGDDGRLSASMAIASMRRARARELGVPVFTTPRLVLDIVDRELRAWAVAFVRFCRGQGARPQYSSDAEHARRAVELRLARECGIADPAGFLYGGELLRRPAKPRKTGAFRGVAGQLAEERTRMSYGGWHG